jgi:hypothetical protein
LLLALAVDARAASTLYAGTSLGPYKSADGGATWKQILVAASDPVLQGAPKLLAIAIQVPSTLADGDWPIQAGIGGVQSPAGTVLTVHH